MAVIATLSVVESSIPAGQPARLVLTISNTGSEQIDFARASVSLSGASGSVSTPTLSPASTTGIAATTGTLALPFAAVFAANMQPAGSSTEQTPVNITAIAYTTTAAGATSPVASNTLTLQITPNGGSGAAFAMPVADTGQLRFDSNNNAVLLPVLL